MVTTVKLALRLVVLCLLATGLSFAATALYVVGKNASLGEDIWIYDNGTNKSVWSGGINVNVGGTDPQTNGDPRVLYCIELTVNINTSTYNTVIDYANTDQEERVAWLLINYYPTTALQGAAFQLAAWDIMEDDGDGFGTTTTHQGIVSQSTDSSHPTDSAVLALADTYRIDAMKPGHVSISAYIYNDTNQAYPYTAVQDLIGETPEPAAISMMLGGLVLIALSRLRRRRSIKKELTALP